MGDVTRIPTKFGQGHTDAIAFFQDQILPRLIENKINTLVLRGLTADGDELQYTMIDVSGERSWNLRTLGQLAEAQCDYASEMASVALGEWKL